MKESIKKFFKGDVEDSEAILSKYSHDASIFELRPKLVLFPRDTSDVQNLVKWVNENKENYPELSITARAAGTDMSGGAINTSLILDFTKYMHKLVSFEENGEEAFITVEPGMFYRDFEKITQEKGYVLPCFTASKDLNAMGGMFGNNSAGERTLSYGKTEDYIHKTKIVFSDGHEYEIKALDKVGLDSKKGLPDTEGKIYNKIFKLIEENKDTLKKAKPNVHKNSAGYYLWNVCPGSTEKSEIFFDLNKLLVGSQGTLGIATEITFRVIKPKKYSRLLVVFLRDLKKLPALVNKILEHKPQAIESYDDKTSLLVLKYIRSFAKLMGVSSLLKLFLSFGPEIRMTLRHGMPRIILLVEMTDDNENIVEQKAKALIEDLSSIKHIGLHLTKNDFEAKKYWTMRHQAFSLIRSHLKKMKSEPFVDDVIVRPEKLPEFYPALYEILNTYKEHMTFAVGGHSGDGNMHIYTLMSPKDPDLRKIILEVAEKVYQLVVDLGGSITAEHNDGLIRTPYLKMQYGEEVLSLFKEVKDIFDPKNIFNPGKKVPSSSGAGTKEFLVEHITKPKS